MTSTYKTLCKEVSALEKQLEAMTIKLSAEKSRLRKLVKVNNKFSTFTELEFNGRKIRVKYNSYGDCTITENGKEIDSSYPKTGFVRPSINDLRLALASGRI